MRKSIAVVIFVLLLLTSLLQGASQTAYSQNHWWDVRHLRQRNQDLEKRRQYIQNKKNEKLKQVRLIDTNIVRNQKKLDETRDQMMLQQNNLSVTKTRLEYLADSMDQTLGEVMRLSKQAGQRLKDIYTGERLSLLQLILDAQDISSLLDRVYYKQKLVEQDQKLLTNLRVKYQVLGVKKQQLAIQKERIGQIINTIQGYQVQIDQRIQADRVLRERYKNDALYYQRAEQQLLAESASIQAQIQRLSRSTRYQQVTGGTGMFMWPVMGPITSGFGYRVHPIARRSIMHTGLDIARPTGTPIRAADGGQVFYAGWRGGYGKVVMINHGTKNGQNLVTLYGHMSSWMVSSGQSVAKGQVIGAVGSTGYSTGPHLHFEIRVNGSPVDPRRFL